MRSLLTSGICLQIDLALHSMREKSVCEISAVSCMGAPLWVDTLISSEFPKRNKIVALDMICSSS